MTKSIAAWLVIPALFLGACSCDGSNGGDPDGSVDGSVDPDGSVATSSLGGTITNLVGTGLVLSSGATTLSVAAASTTFSFPAEFANGSTYNVQVQTQPSSPAQVCTASMNTGTLSADVSNVSITCVTATHAISGTISGYDGSGLVLNNGATTVAVAASSTTFAFESEFDEGSTYDVQVQTQPSSPTQTCVSTTNTGTLAADVTNVAITCTTNTYPITVTVMGLEGTGLVLRNNGGDDLAVVPPITPGSAMATFSAEIASGEDFDVSVLTNPSGPPQTCAVVGGMGTVVAGEITSVVVNCSTLYTVSGTVSGLLGSGFVLLDTEGDDIAINMNGTFAVADMFLSGASYAVTVGTNPSSPAQTCVVTDGAGTIGTSNVTNIVVTCSCASPTSVCGAPGAEFCTDLSGDTANCGVCGRTCDVGDTCGGGECHGTSSFAFTGGAQTFTVPAHVTSIFLEVAGAQGGSGATGGNGSTGGPGGLGGFAQGNLSVTPGQVLTIFVGGAGATPTGGFNGGANGGSTNAGGGGGASDVRTGGATLADRVIIGGGGGGGGRAGCETNTVAGGTGGAGGGGSGANGTDAPTSGGVAGGGAGAVGSSAGAAGIGCGGFLGAPGAATSSAVGGTGGAGQSCCCFTFGSIPGGGGGGGGLVGGGGGGGGSAGTSGCSGNDKGAGGGGAGGTSSAAGVTTPVTTPGVTTGNGSVTISW